MDDGLRVKDGAPEKVYKGGLTDLRKSWKVVFSKRMAGGE
jgi:hypothetical protein